MFRETDPEFLQFLITDGVLSPDELDQQKMTALMIAADQNDLETVRFLLKQGAQVDVRFNEDYRKGMTILH
jgi:ankyrin repeat protein